MRDRCPVCDQPAPAELARSLEMPILMNRIYSTPEAGRSAARAPLEFVACRSCGFAWNRAFDASLIVYDEEYENDQTFSPAFRAHMEARARDVVASVPAGEPICYLEVGCGQGRFIEEIVKAADGRLRAAEGFDPAWRGREGEGPAGSRIYRAYFGVETASRLLQAPNVVVTRHTIEHVPDPLEFLVAIREALGPDSPARLWIETPCVDWIVRHRAMQDFFYEHCSLFTASSLALVLRRAGFESPRVEHVFGGQYLWAEAMAGHPADEAVAEIPADHEYLDRVRDDFVRHWRQSLVRASAQGPVALWGAGAKGVSFSILIDPDHDTINHVVDVNPAKQGHFLPGSGLPVVSPEESALRNPGTIFVMNVNYLDEIAVTAREVGLTARLVPIDDGESDEDQH
ncbi:class I SAM-dependent methyltransferase [uncultured Parvibaculum sp.]|uniref:class I SAM-dependent methyltransferase n=1 Tax=uncultured Parvibaculum sp. TaxID=291828 RepID=UPI0030DB002A